MNIILASASPRRRELLQAIGLPITIQIPAIDEDSLNGLRPDIHALTLAIQKAEAIANATGAAEAIIIAADTVVVVDGRILGKPSSSDDARAMLTTLRGRDHTVITAVAVMQTQPRATHVNKATTRVRFRDYSNDELEAYIATDEPYDKAGAYAIQGRGGELVQSIEGDYFNVVGLPMNLLLELLGFYMDVRPFATRLAALPRDSRF